MCLIKVDTYQGSHFISVASSVVKIYDENGEKHRSRDDNVDTEEKGANHRNGFRSGWSLVCNQTQHETHRHQDCGL